MVKVKIHYHPFTMHFHCDYQSAYHAYCTSTWGVCLAHFSIKIWTAKAVCAGASTGGTGRQDQDSEMHGLQAMWKMILSAIWFFVAGLFKTALLLLFVMLRSYVSYYVGCHVACYIS